MAFMVPFQERCEPRLSRLGDVLGMDSVSSRGRVHVPSASFLVFDSVNMPFSVL